MNRTTQSRLRNLRKARTINQKQLASLVGVSQVTISRAERDATTLSTDLQERIAAILGTSRHELFPDEVVR